MALFKIYNNIDNPRSDAEGKPILPEVYNKGYMYFDAQTKVFYIDLEGTGSTTGVRVAVNAEGAHKAYADENADRISTTYAKIADLSDLVAFSTTASPSLKGTLTFGSNSAYVFDGTEDVTVPVYTGAYTIS